MAEKELQAIKDAWDKKTGEGRDDAKARELADKYVKAHPEHFAALDKKSVEELVKAVDVFREAGWEDEQWRVEAFLLSQYEPQEIGGTATPKLRIR